MSTTRQNLSGLFTWHHRPVSVPALVIAVFGKAFGKQVIGEDTSLRKAVHAFVDADVNVAVVDERE